MMLQVASILILILLLGNAHAFDEPVELDFPQPKAEIPAAPSKDTPKDAIPIPTIQSSEDEGEVINSEQEVIASIEKAQQFLLRAEATHVSAGKCDTLITAAIGSLSLAETFILEDKYEDANTQIENARKTISSCNKAIDASSEAYAGKAIIYLTKQAVNQIDSSNKPLEHLTKNQPKVEDPTFHPETVSGSSTIAVPCSADGTQCQFNQCGKGTLLPKCVVGFASGVTGGAKGQTYVVTTNEDNSISPAKGSLRYGVSLGGTDKGGVWITFSKSMIITLTEMLWVRSSTTIDGRGFNITINGRSIVLAGVTNVILHNFQINTVGETDTVHIFAGSKKVWVDHLTSFNAKLGLVSVLQGSTDVTISNCYLSNPNFNMLLGASDADIQDQIMRVTVYRNWFRDSMQRMPHCRWGYCHVINNLYTNWGYYAIGGRVRAKIKSENNVFIASRRSEITPWFSGAGSDFDMTATIESHGDLLLNGTTFHQFVQFGPAVVPQYESTAMYPPKKSTSSLTGLIQKCAGSLFGTRLQKCLA